MIDLHIHSKFSDGDKTIPELIDMLKRKKVELFSITDHDSVDSLKVLENIPNITYIPGVEMSAVSDGVKMHILGYGIDDNSKLKSTCEIIKKTRKELVLEILEDLIKRGYKFSEEDLSYFYNSESSCIGKVEISKFLVKNGYALSVKDAFYEILGRYKIGPRIRKNAEQIIDEIHEKDGLAILAHPFEIVRKQGVEIAPVIDELEYYGLDGVEVFTTKHNKEEEKYMYDLCRNRGLLISGGSDYHGPLTKPNIQICDSVKGDEISEKIKKKRIKH
ncbi:MAG: PHP domain-containing protein [Bacilli bacterium]|nr:PHP domain-containing protein [Bacilli bacterium]